MLPSRCVAVRLRRVRDLLSRTIPVVFLSSKGPPLNLLGCRIELDVAHLLYAA